MSYTIAKKMRIQTLYDPEYATCHYTHAWLRIMSDDFDLEEVTCLVKATPTETQKKGDLQSAAKQRHYKKTGWWISSEGIISSKDSRDHIDFILSQVTEAGDGFRVLHSRGYLVDLCIRWDSKFGHGGPTLSPIQMSRLAVLDIEVWFDIYFHGDDFAGTGETSPSKPPICEQDTTSNGV
jgi:Domain of unknown function (DUF4279)